MGRVIGEGDGIGGYWVIASIKSAASSSVSFLSTRRRATRSKAYREGGEIISVFPSLDVTARVL